MRLIGGELLKLRRRWASYIVLAVLIVLMTIVYLLVGSSARGGPDFTSQLFLRFPNAYGILNQFVFGLGGLLALCYAAAIGGADWNWGVFRVIIARGESRAGYVLAKAAGLAIVLFVGVLIAFAAGIALTFMAGSIAGINVGNPFGGEGLRDLLTSLGLGLPVLFERAAIGFAVAMLLRSQMAGVIAGIVLFFGEDILTLIVLALSVSGGFLGDGTGPSGPEWYQYLPFGIGDSVLAAAPGITGDPGSFVLQPVPLTAALIVTGAYLLGSLAIAVISAERSQITT